MEISEIQLLKLMTTLILDFSQWKNRLELDDSEVSIKDVSDFCRDWLNEEKNAKNRKIRNPQNHM